MYLWNYQLNAPVKNIFGWLIRKMLSINKKGHILKLYNYSIIFENVYKWLFSTR